MTKAIVIVLMLYAGTAHSQTPESVTCTAWTHDQSREGAIERVKLEKSSIDPEYYQAEIGNYSFGADFTFLRSEGVGLAVHDRKTRRFAESTPGFRRIGNTKHRQADLKYYDRLPDGRTVVAGLQCGFEIP